MNANSTISTIIRFDRRSAWLDNECTVAASSRVRCFRSSLPLSGLVLAALALVACSSDDGATDPALPPFGGAVPGAAPATGQPGGTPAATPPNAGGVSTPTTGATPTGEAGPALTGNVAPPAGSVPPAGGEAAAPGVAGEGPQLLPLMPPALVRGQGGPLLQNPRDL